MGLKWSSLNVERAEGITELRIGSEYLLVSQFFEVGRFLSIVWCSSLVFSLQCFYSSVSSLVFLFSVSFSVFPLRPYPVDNFSFPGHYKSGVSSYSSEVENVHILEFDFFGEEGRKQNRGASRGLKGTLIELAMTEQH